MGSVKKYLIIIAILILYAVGIYLPVRSRMSSEALAFGFGNQDRERQLSECLIGATHDNGDLWRTNCLNLNKGTECILPAEIVVDMANKDIQARSRCLSKFQD